MRVRFTMDSTFQTAQKLFEIIENRIIHAPKSCQERISLSRSSSDPSVRGDWGAARSRKPLSIDSTLRSEREAHYSAGVFLFFLGRRVSGSICDQPPSEAAIGSRKSPRFPFHVSDTRSAADKSAAGVVSFAVKQKK